MRWFLLIFFFFMVSNNHTRTHTHKQTNKWTLWSSIFLSKVYGGYGRNRSEKYSSCPIWHIQAVWKWNWGCKTLSPQVTNTFNIYNIHIHTDSWSGKCTKSFLYILNSFLFTATTQEILRQIPIVGSLYSMFVSPEAPKKQKSGRYFSLPTGL